MTKRLYYTDSYLTAFDAIVTEAGIAGGRHFVVLDRTAFYPTTGGQPHDAGTLGGRRVLDVIDRDADGEVLHVIDAPLAEGAAVSGALEWPRRLDHMQQHTGQHVLSAAFLHVLALPTVSFHMGREVSTIDLGGTTDDEAISRAEDEANRVVWDDRPVAVRFVGAEEAAALPLRREPVRGGTLRLVEVDGFDLSACGGTHVARTGAIGIIAVQSWERYKGGTRVTFVCGGRALRAFRASRDVVASCVRQLSIQASELPGTLSRMQAESREARQRVRALGDELAVHRAAALAAEAEPVGGARVVCRSVDGDAPALKTLAAAIASRAGHVAVLVGAARPSVVVVSRAEGVAVDSGAVVRALVARFGGKGGGRADSAQAGGLDADAGSICRVTLDLLSAQLLAAMGSDPCDE